MCEILKQDMVPCDFNVLSKMFICDSLNVMSKKISSGNPGPDPTLCKRKGSSTAK